MVKRITLFFLFLYSLIFYSCKIFPPLPSAGQNPVSLVLSEPDCDLLYPRSDSSFVYFLKIDKENNTLSLNFLDIYSLTEKEVYEGKIRDYDGYKGEFFIIVDSFLNCFYLDLKNGSEVLIDTGIKSCKFFDNNKMIVLLDREGEVCLREVGGRNDAEVIFIDTCASFIDYKDSVFITDKGKVYDIYGNFLKDLGYLGYDFSVYGRDTYLFVSSEYEGYIGWYVDGYVEFLNTKVSANCIERFPSRYISNKIIFSVKKDSLSNFELWSFEIY